LASLDEAGAAVVDSGLTYGDGPVVVRLRRRGQRYDITDDGAAVARAGKPAGWLAKANRLLSAEGFSINRAGVVFVPAVQGRDITSLAESSRTVYLALLDLADQRRVRA
jgi:hypothetical protein